MIGFDLQGLFEQYTYVAVFAALVLMGLGLPIPEELALVLAGYLAWAHLARLWLMMATCATAILLGDLLPYLAGRLFGERLLRSRAVRKWASPRRLKRFNHLFLRYGAKVIFFARFFPGIRSLAYLVAGSLRMPIPRFLFLDGLGILVTVPTFVAVGYWFGDGIDAALGQIRRLERGLMLAIGIPLGLLLLCYWWRRLFGSSRRRRRPESGAGSAGDADDDEWDWDDEEGSAPEGAPAGPAAATERPEPGERPCAPPPPP